VHFYHQIDPEELYRLSTRNIEYIETLQQAILDWIRANPERTGKDICLLLTFIQPESVKQESCALAVSGT